MDKENKASKKNGTTEINYKKEKEKKELSKERKKYKQKQKKEKILVCITQILVLIGFLALWEILADKKVIDSFITSQPSRILKTLLNLGSNGLLKHVGVTVYETVVGFLLGTIMGIFIAILLWWSKFLAKVSEPYLVVLNSLPKVALRSSNYYLGWSRNTGNNCYGCSNLVGSNNSRKLKWIFANRHGSNKNGKNI